MNEKDWTLSVECGDQSLGRHGYDMKHGRYMKHQQLIPRLVTGLILTNGDN